VDHRCATSPSGVRPESSTAWYRRAVVMDDRELFRAWRAGDRQAGGELFSRHFDAVYSFFRNKLDGDVEDLVQRTFVACVEGRERFREDAQFRTYLFAVAQNLLYDHFRRRRLAGETIDIDAYSAADLGMSPSSVIAARAEERVLLQALRRLPLSSQVLLELYFWENLTGSELGAFLGVVEDTARSRLRKAKRQLEEMIRTIEAAPHELTSTLGNLEQWAQGVRRQLSPA
jgi:RNA polymerase sigma factor (sigma-70 family)